MTEVLHGPWPEAHGPDPRREQAGGSAIGTESFAGSIEERVVALRREAVVAVVRQGEIRTRLLALQERSRAVEADAERALVKGGEAAARAVLAREMATLVRRDVLAEELLEAQRLTIRLLKDAVRLQDRARAGRIGTS